MYPYEPCLKNPDFYITEIAEKTLQQYILYKKPEILYNVMGGKNLRSDFKVLSRRFDTKVGILISKNPESGSELR